MKIKRLHIYTKNIEKQRNFYKHTLQLPVKTISSKRIEVVIGYSILEIKENPEFTPYHIAFHISAEKEKEALAWLKKRIGILKLGDSEIVDFSGWNAMSLYFYDEEFNILEFISRRHLHSSDRKGFSENDICGIAEIGLVTQDVKSTYERIRDAVGLEQYSGDLEKFCPIGDDHGLLITVDNRKKKTWFPTPDKAEMAPFRLDFTHHSKRSELWYDGKNVCIKSKENLEK